MLSREMVDEAVKASFKLYLAGVTFLRDVVGRKMRVQGSEEIPALLLLLY